MQNLCVPYIKSHVVWPHWIQHHNKTGIFFTVQHYISGVLYGQGVYFAADASYSAQSYLTGYKPGQKRYMFLVKALTGDLVKGNPSMRVLPPVKPSQSTVLYDCAVDDINNPMEFVIFHDTQAYPEYLITYTS